MHFQGRRLDKGTRLTLVLLHLTSILSVPSKVVEPFNQSARTEKWIADSVNKFGIGVYNDTAEPGLDDQLYEASKLLGTGGPVLLFFNIDFYRTGNASSCINECHPDHWQLNAIRQAYALGLKPIVRIGQWSRQIRSFSDDALHRNYTSLAKAYRTFVSAIPRPPDGTPLPIILLNEPNVCSEWQCGDGPGMYLNSSTMAAEAASCLRDLASELKSLPRIRLSMAPIAYAAPERCECIQPGHNVAPNYSQPNDVGFIQSMLDEVPDLWTGSDFFNAHTYAFNDLPFTNPLGRAGIENYRAQLHAIGRSASVNAFPVAISETGWKSNDPQMNAVSMVSAYQQVYLPDPVVFAVMPFLFAVYNDTESSSSDFLRFSWMDWAEDGTRMRLPVAQATYELRCSLHIGGPCSNKSILLQGA